MARGRQRNARGRGGGRGGRGRGGGGGGGGRQYQDNRVSFDQVVKQNEKLELFYNTLNLVPAGPEREAFWATLRRELPNSFRFTGSKGHALGVRNNLVERFFPLIKEIKHEGRSVELPRQIAWYPEGLAYAMTTPKNVVRKYEPFKEFQRFLVSETGVGNISRQEEVSMIPPLLLDVRPEHTVLDLCAAPGSKSAQLIEAVHAGEEERVEKAIQSAKAGDTNGDDAASSLMRDNGRSTGLLVANDVNYQRAQMLVHQVKRLNSPNLIVTNHDATLFPSIELPSPPQPDSQSQRRKYLKFDRILADVPCSGDGTCRKNPSIWKEWTPQNALGLYGTQVRILVRALQMLKVGGRVVYSTCSMNPVEDEAVVSSAIERCGGVGKVRLLDCSDQLPGLKRSTGLTDWSIMARSGQIYESYPEAEQYESEGSKVMPGMFPPVDAEQIPLQHCMRLYPHQQDTGAFFIAVLEKRSEIKAKPESESKCGKRDWTFTTPAVETEPEDVPLPEPKTTFAELVDEVERPRPDGTTATQNSVAAAQQVEMELSDAVPGAGAKRKAAVDASDDQEMSTKKQRLDDGTNADSAAGTSELFQNGVPDGDSIAAHPTAEPTTSTSNVQSENSGISDLQLPPRKRRNRDEPANEEAFKYLSPDHPELLSIYNFYVLHDAFPRTRFLVRNPAGDPVKGIYYSSALVKDILTTNEGRGMKFVHAGVKMFMKQDSQGQDICRWRIQTEGLPIVEGWVGEARVVRLRKRATLRKLLVEMFPRIGARDSPEGTGWRALDEIGEQVLDIGMGCCVLRVDASEEEDGFVEPLTLPLWRSLHSLNLMLPKEERRAMLLRIFNEDVELVNHSDPRQGANGQGKMDDSAPKGSISGEAEAKELERRIAEAPDEDTPDGIAGAGVSNGATLQGAEAGASTLSAEEMDAEAAGMDLDVVENRRRASELETVEDEGRKVADAMPERQGEADVSNSTV